MSKRKTSVTDLIGDTQKQEQYLRTGMQIMTGGYYDRILPYTAMKARVLAGETPPPLEFESGTWDNDLFQTK